jgi:hypothetical protein
MASLLDNREAFMFPAIIGRTTPEARHQLHRLKSDAEADEDGPNE